MVEGGGAMLLSHPSAASPFGNTKSLKLTTPRGFGRGIQVTKHLRPCLILLEDAIRNAILSRLVTESPGLDMGHSSASFCISLRSLPYPTVFRPSGYDHALLPQAYGVPGLEDTEDSITRPDSLRQTTSHTTPGRSRKGLRLVTIMSCPRCCLSSGKGYRAAVDDKPRGDVQRLFSKPMDESEPRFVYGTRIETACRATFVMERRSPSAALGKDGDKDNQPTGRSEARSIAAEGM
ncbi:hypothetical protein TgHK011_004445 [Trichoderma gracile]|nr:hypothetical protein TgHK011_004445 [Trichoderma gracile]